MESEVRLRDIKRNHSTESFAEPDATGRVSKVKETDKGSDSANDYRDFVYSIFDLCYSMVTGENQSKKYRVKV